MKIGSWLIEINWSKLVEIPIIGLLSFATTDICKAAWRPMYRQIFIVNNIISHKDPTGDNNCWLALIGSHLNSDINI